MFLNLGNLTNKKVRKKVETQNYLIKHSNALDLNSTLGEALNFKAI